jgi:glycosyltransferase involved in cell wall biosynthesis
MKILYISNEYPPETGFGGIGTYTRTIAEYLHEHGHDVHVIARSSDGTCRVTESNGVTVHRIVPGAYPLPRGKPWYPVRRVMYMLLPQVLVRLSWAKAVAAYLHTRLSHMAFDIVEYPECGAEGLFIRPPAKKVVRLHSPWGVLHRYEAPRLPWTDGLAHRLLEMYCVYRSSHLTSPTAFLVRALGVSHIPHHLVPNPIRTDRYPAAEGKDIVCIGRLDPVKAPHLLVRAYDEAYRTHRRALPPLKLIGRGYGTLRDTSSYASYIEKAIACSSAADSITIIPGITHDEVPAYLQGARIAVFTSLWENMPYSCLEAMAAGCIVIAPDCTGFRELIDHETNGFLFRPHDTHALARMLETVCFSYRRPALSRIAHAARYFVQSRCDVTVAGARIERIYAGLAGERVSL